MQVVVSAMPDVTGALNSSAPADVQRAEFIERFDPDVIDWSVTAQPRVLISTDTHLFTGH